MSTFKRRISKRLCLVYDGLASLHHPTLLLQMFFGFLLPGEEEREVCLLHLSLLSSEPCVTDHLLVIAKRLNSLTHKLAAKTHAKERQRPGVLKGAPP